jgi:hypothetical protein
MSPKVIGDLLFIGSTAIENPGTKYKFQIYDTDNFSRKKEYLFTDMINSWQITSWDNKAYFGVHPGYADGRPTEYGSVIELDLNTLDTVEIGAETDFFLNSYLDAVRQDSLLYIFNSLGKDICIYDFQSETITLTAKASEYPEIAVLQAEKVAHPYYYNGSLYAQYEYTISNGSGVAIHLVKFNPNTLEYISQKKLDTPMGVTYGSLQYYEGHYLIIQFIQDTQMKIIFYDIESGNKEHEVNLPANKYY